MDAAVRGLMDSKILNWSVVLKGKKIEHGKDKVYFESLQTEHDSRRQVMNFHNAPFTFSRFLDSTMQLQC